MNTTPLPRLESIMSLPSLGSAPLIPIELLSPFSPFAPDIMQFKPADMSLEEFHRRMYEFINYYPSLSQLAEQNKVMEMKISVATGREYPTRNEVSIAAAHGALDVLKWIKDEYGILPDQVDIMYAVMYDRLNVLKWIYEETGTLPDIDHVYMYGHSDIINWLASIGID